MCTVATIAQTNEILFNRLYEKKKLTIQCFDIL